jgi:hypothetical protein
MIYTRQLRQKVPDTQNWADYRDDSDVRFAHKLLFGQTVEEVQGLFGQDRSLERAGELLFAPIRRVFHYYVFALTAYVLFEAAAEDSDSASPLLHLLFGREKNDPSRVCEIYFRIAPIVAAWHLVKLPTMLI